MENYFKMNLTKAEIDAISNLGLAHMGDCVFEILVRAYLCASGEKTEVTKDEVVGQENVNGVSYEVHLVTHTCQACGTEYTCHEYKRV